MSLPINKLSNENAKTLLEAIFSTSLRERSGTCLSDEEFAQYASDMLPDPEIQRIDIHLASCPACCAEMESLLEAAEKWRDEDVQEKIAVLRAGALSSRQEPSPLDLMVVGIASALGGHVTDGARRLLLIWESWLKGLGEESLQYRVWKPVSIGGLLAPSTGDSGREPSRLAIDLALSSPLEIVYFEVSASFIGTVHVTVKGRPDIAAALILLNRQTGHVDVSETLYDSTLSVHRARFSQLIPGSYLIAVSPSVNP